MAVIILDQVDETIKWLFENDAKEMRKICNKYMMKFGGISEMDYDDFYSQVGWDVSIASKNYNPTDDKPFKEFVYGVIKLSVWKQMTHRNRGKRQLIVEKKVIDDDGNVKIEKEYISNVSLDAPSPSDVDLIEKLPSPKNVEDEICEQEISESTEKYLDNLSTDQRNVALLIMDGYSKEEILLILHIENDEYNNCMKGLRSYRNISLLF